MIQFHKVSKVYPPDDTGVKDLTFQVEDGEFLFLCGPSGAGKTTLLRLLFRAEQATEGQVIVSGRNITRLKGKGLTAFRRRLGLVFQDFKLIPWMTALEKRVAGRGRGPVSPGVRAGAGRSGCWPSSG